MRDFFDFLVGLVMKIVNYQLIRGVIKQLIIIHFSQADKSCLQDLGYTPIPYFHHNFREKSSRRLQSDGLMAVF